MSEKIDVLLATYNGEKYIKCQLDSILNQTYKDIRILINDDCSTDNTKNILEEYAKKDSRVAVKYNKTNLGCTKNFEELLKRVESNYFMLSDQDDYWQPDKIEKSFKKLIDENAGLVFTDLEVVDKDLQTIHQSAVRFKETKKNIDKHQDYKLVFLRNCISGCTIISKKEYIEKCIPIPDQKPLVHDWWIALQVSQYGKLMFLDEPTIKYRQTGNNEVGLHGMKEDIDSFDEYREKYINLKLTQFKIYEENKDRFENKEIVDLTENAIKYLNNIKSKKYFNFRNYKTFFRLYNMEYLYMRIKTFIMLNLPIIGRFTYKIFK